MATSDSPHAENGTLGTKVPSLTALDLMDSWLTATRQMIDLWRDTVRQQQDSMFAAFRQIASAAPDELMEDDDSEEPRPARRTARTGSQREESVPTQH